MIANARPVWSPGTSLASMRFRAQMLQRIRQYLDASNSIEVETPALSTSAVSDVHIESIAAQLAVAPGQPFFLHTSPEFAMKRLLAAGFPDIYQICKVFRDGEAGARHQPEFTLLEWYRHDFNLSAIMQDTVQLISNAIGPALTLDDPEFISYEDAFMVALQISPATTTVEELALGLSAEAELRSALGNDKQDWLDWAMTTAVAPRFSATALTVVFHYPAEQSALARLCPDNAGVADRFEVFFGELELANGYVELTDAAEQRQRFSRDQAQRARLARRQRPLDACFLAALEAGLPACAGVAVGIDRLLMAALQLTDIAAAQSFAVIDHTGIQT